MRLGRNTLLLFKDKEFRVIIPGKGLGDVVVPKAGDSIDVYSSDPGMEAALGKLRLRLNGNRVEEIRVALPTIRREGRYQKKHANNTR